MKRVVITGIGAITSIGNTPDDVLLSFQNNKTCFERSTIDEDLVVCPIHNFNLKNYISSFKNVRYLNRGNSFALACATLAVQDANIAKKDLASAGLFVSVAPNLNIGEDFSNICDGKIDWKKNSALWILKFLPNTSTSIISQYLDIHGESAVIGNACAASLHAIGYAYQKIKWGNIDLALAGGGDSRISEGGLMAYKKADAIYTGKMEPHKVCMPFDKKREGFICGEGGAFFLLEEMTQAQKRNAHIYAEILGVGATTDGYSMTAPEPSGKWAQIAVQKAIDEANLSFQDIEIIATHGTSTILNDEMESQMLARIFSKGATVTAFKSWIGHLSASCGAVELALALYCAKNKYFPPIRNLEEPCTKD
ncbi:MAG: beta-ketoacyl-[acyl-carrier-protein] synthase family protein, partial [Deltaproteobacteria bacterium]